MSFPIKDLNLNLIKIRACEVGSQSQLAFLLLAAWWSQQTSDHSDKISLLIANVKVATLRLEFVNRDFKIQQRGRQRERQKKTIGLISKTTTSHVYLCFWTFLSCFCTTTTWKCLIWRFMEDVNKQRRNFISLSELGYGPLKFSFRRVRLHLTK